MILVATITSLPELSTGVSAVVLAGSPDIAVGDVIGSCVFNLLLFAVADMICPRGAFYSRLSQTHNLTAAFSMLLLGILALAILVPETARFSIGHVGVYPLILAALYFGAARLLYAVNVSPTGASEESTLGPAISLRSAVVRCVIAASAIMAAGILLALSASRIAAEASLTESFVGSLLVAAATSMPELAVTVAAVRLGAFDVAAGNLLGSNLFNMLILVVDDIAYVEGPLLASVSATLAVPAVVAIVMTAIVIAALNYVKRTTPRLVDAGAGFSLLALYVFNAWLIFVSSGR
jgi:cation:H+ antiporter